MQPSVCQLVKSTCWVRAWMRPPDTVSPIRGVWSPTGHRITAHLLSHNGRLLFQASHGNGSLALKPNQSLFSGSMWTILMFFLDKAKGSFGAWSGKIVLLCAVGERVEWDRNLSHGQLLVIWGKKKEKRKILHTYKPSARTWEKRKQADIKN